MITGRTPHEARLQPSDTGLHDVHCARGAAEACAKQYPVSNRWKPDRFSNVPSRFLEPLESLWLALKSSPLKLQERVNESTWDSFIAKLRGAGDS